MDVIAYPRWKYSEAMLAKAAYVFLITNKIASHQSNTHSKL